jgi:hypothetical protein
MLTSIASRNRLVERVVVNEDLRWVLSIDDLDPSSLRALPRLVTRLLASNTWLVEIPRLVVSFTGRVGALVPMTGVTSLQTTLTKASAWIAATNLTRPRRLIRPRRWVILGKADYAPSVGT